MKRALSALGGLLIVLGGALLAYAGFMYLHQSSPTEAVWSSTQRHKGQEIAARLSTPQAVTVPRRLGTGTRVSPGVEPALGIIIPKISLHAPVVQTAPVNGVWDVA